MIPFFSRSRYFSYLGSHDEVSSLGIETVKINNFPGVVSQRGTNFVFILSIFFTTRRLENQGGTNGAPTLSAASRSIQCRMTVINE
jgi:hypothetical protein